MVEVLSFGAINYEAPQIDGYKSKLNGMIEDLECRPECHPGNDPEIDDVSTAESCGSSITSIGDIQDPKPTLKIVDIPQSVSWRTQQRVRGGSIMSARSLEQSLKGDSYLEAARQRRFSRRASSIAEQSRQSRRISDPEGLEDSSFDSDKLSVCFSAVEVREFAVQIGDNPSVSSGPPITIAWDHFNEHTLDIDVYESDLPPRRKHKEMMVPYKERWRRLVEDAELTDDQIFEETKKVNTARYNRAATIVKMKDAWMEEKIEKMKRLLRKIFNRKQMRIENEMIRATREKDRREREKRLAEDLY